MMTETPVAKETFDLFIASNHATSKGLSMVAEPPVTLYADRSGVVVAKVLHWPMMSAHPAYNGEPEEYRIFIWVDRPTRERGDLPPMVAGVADPW